MDWTYALSLDLGDPGFDFTLLESAKTWGELRHHRAIQTTR
jgi:hypothetical protein